MIKLHQLSVLSIALLLTACTETNDQPLTSSLDKNQTNSTYDSAIFSATTQYKTHQIAAFVVPTDQASLSFQVSGMIEEQYIKIGDKVEKGQQLFKVSNPSLEPQILQFSSQIDAINATLEQNKVEVQRFKNLKTTNAVSQNELDRLTNQSDNLLANKKSVEAQLEQAQSLFEESYLKAPSHSMNASVKEISLSANPTSQLFKVMLDVPIMHQIKSGEKITVQIKENIGDFFRLPIESVIDDGINQPFVLLIVNHQVVRTPIELIEIIGDEAIVNMQQQGAVEVVISGQAKLSPQQNLRPS